MDPGEGQVVVMPQGIYVQGALYAVNCNGAEPARCLRRTADCSVGLSVVRGMLCNPPDGLAAPRWFHGVTEDSLRLIPGPGSVSLEENPRQRDPLDLEDTGIEIGHVHSPPF